MLNQSISKENLRRIFDYENRKGCYLEGQFFPDVAKYSEKIKRINHVFRTLARVKKIISKDTYIKRKDNLNNTKLEVIQIRDELINKNLEEIVNQLNKKEFALTVEQHHITTNKPVFTLGKSPEVFFLVKHLQYTLKRLYNIKQNNRERIILQLKAILNDKLPKYIIKIDIKNFYESINRKKLFSKLSDIPLLTFNSKRFITQIISKYEQIIDNKNGLPRGIGISAYLSELYMLDIDESIKSIPDVIYYARYVDDIVVVFSPILASDVTGYLKEIENLINNYDLHLNDKTKQINFYNKKSGYEFNYLGYDIKYSSKTIKILIGKKKIDRYKSRIDSALSDYEKKEIYKGKSSRKLLIKRIQFLTGNTKLSNSKKTVMVGIYYSNRLNCDAQILTSLDSYLQYKIRSLHNSSLKKRLSKFSFVEGFDKKIFRNFTAKDLGHITSVWKDD